MKITLEFEEITEALEAINGVHYRATLQQVDEAMRRELKDHNQNLVSVNGVRDMICRLLDERGLSLYE